MRGNLLRLIYETKWFVPLATTMLFAVCVTVGAVWGLMVNSPHPSLGDLPIYPGARSIVDQNGNPVSRLATDAISRQQATVRYTFRTEDPVGKVAATYKDSMEHTYGFVGTQIEHPSAGTTVLRFARRALRDTWVVESIEVTVASEPTGETVVNLRVDVRW